MIASAQYRTLQFLLSRYGPARFFAFAGSTKGASRRAQTRYPSSFSSLSSKTESTDWASIRSSSSMICKEGGEETAGRSLISLSTCSCQAISSIRVINSFISISMTSKFYLSRFKCFRILGNGRLEWPYLHWRIYGGAIVFCVVLCKCC